MLLHLLILRLLTFGSVVMMPLRHFQRTSINEAFIRNAKSFCRTLPTPTFPLSFTVGDGSHYVTSQSHVLSCLSRSFTPTCTGIDRSVTLFFTRVRGMHIPLTPQLVADVLRVPRIEFPNYPSCKRLRTVSGDELMSAFCEHPTAWGEHLFIPYRPFAKGPRFMNMVMTFILHPLSHYNFITKPRARFLLSLLEYLIIDFSSHFISFHHRCSFRFGVL